jgi:acylphosphatase
MAQRRGVTGWVRNAPDGTVEAVFEGSSEAVDRMVDWCRIGPPEAHVDDVTAAEEPPQGLVAFDVR